METTLTPRKICKKSAPSGDILLSQKASRDSNSHFYKEVNPLDMAFASNFPDNFLFLELSGNFKLTQIANRKYPILEINCNFLAYYNDFQL